MEKKYTIQQASKKTNLSAHTLRYYERIGLTPSIARNVTGHREYSESDIAWINFFNYCLKATGMSISGMLKYAQLRSEGEKTAAERRRMLENHRDEVLRQLEKLNYNLKVLDFKIEHYKDMERSINKENT